MEEKRLVRFDETTLIDFQEMILPNVLLDLYGVEEFAEHGVLALGVLLGEEAIGAVVARTNGDGLVHILSLYVHPDFRRQKVGSMLMDGLAWAGYELYDTPQNPETGLILSVDYLMPQELRAGFEAFLDAVGYRHREALAPVYLIPAAACRKLANRGGAYAIPAEMQPIFNEMLEDSDLNADTDLSTYAGSESEAKCLLQLIDAGDGSYDLISCEPEQKATDAEFESALKLLLSKLDAEATVLANSEKNVHPMVLEKAAGTVLPRTLAQRRLIVAKGA